MGIGMGGDLIILVVAMNADTPLIPKFMVRKRLPLAVMVILR